MDDLTHAVGFLQNAYTILLALSLGEAFKQFVVDGDGKEIKWDRLPLLLAFLFLIFPFFHGMSRYLFTTYLHGSGTLSQYAGYLMLDGIVFLAMAAFFFIMSRSLSFTQWQRFFGATLCLLFVDSAWIGFAIYRGIKLQDWLYLNCLLAGVLALILKFNRSPASKWPAYVCAATTFGTTTISYYLMRDFYFP